MKFENMPSTKKYYSVRKYGEGHNIVGNVEYIKKNGGLFDIMYNRYSLLSMSSIMHMDFEEVPFTPEMGEEYWIVNIVFNIGIEMKIRGGTYRDRQILKYYKIFRNKEEAIIERDKQDWWYNDNICE